MDERKKVILTIVAGLIGLLLLSRSLYLPLVRDNAQRLEQYRQLEQQAQTLEALSQDELNSFQKRLTQAISNLEQRFPPQERLKLAEQLTKVPLDTDIVFTELTRKPPQKRQGYQVFPVDVNLKAQFNDFIKYLSAIEANPMMIGINRLRVAKLKSAAQAKAESLDIDVAFLGVRLSQEFSPLSKYQEQRYNPLNKQRLESLLRPVKLAGSESFVAGLKYRNPFVSTYGTGKVIVPDDSIAAPKLTLQGILRIGEEQAALINDTVVKRGEQIAGMKVMEIQDYQVVLMQAGKKYILKMGADDELIKP